MLFFARRGWLAALSVVVCAGLLSGTAFAQEPVPFGAAPTSRLKLPTIVAGAAASADWITTYHALKNYQVREMNPLLQPFKTPGPMVAAGAAMDIGGVTAWNLLVGRNHPRMAATGLWTMAIFRSYLAIHNLHNEQHAQRR